MGSPLGWHITLRLEDGRCIAGSVGERRVLAGAVLAVGRDRGLIAFSVPDTHVHLLTTARRDEAGRLSQSVACALRGRLEIPVAFERGRYRPLLDQAHLGNAIHYVLGNARRHGNLHDPHCEGTNLPDLLGLRVTGRYTAARLAALLPRLKRAELLGHLQVTELRPGRDPTHLADAAAASVCLPALSVRGAHQRAAATAATHVAAELGLTLGQTAAFLGASSKTIARQRHRLPAPLLVRAIVLQLGLREEAVRTMAASPDREHLRESCSRYRA